MVGPLTDTDGDPGAPTINVKNIDAGALGGPELVIQERPPLTLRNVEDDPWEVPELEIRECPPSTLRNIDGEPPGRCWSWRSWSAHHQR
jgi:hypothetical protein